MYYIGFFTSWIILQLYALLIGNGYKCKTTGNELKVIIIYKRSVRKIM